MRNRFVQLLAGATPFDATTELARALAAGARNGSLFSSSAIFADHIAPALRDEVRELRDYRPRATDRVLVHYGTRIVGLDKTLSGVHRYGLYYHNITPARFLSPYSLYMAAELELARRALPRLVMGAGLHLAASDFSASELRRVGAREVLVVPPVVGMAAHPQSSGDVPAAGTQKRLLFVSRLAPNKGHARLIKMFALLRRSMEDVRLVFAGRPVVGAEEYVTELQRLSRYLRLQNQIDFTGELSVDDLAGAYRSADLFVCASEHEGFCVPIYEAMSFGLPVVAWASAESAVAQTMGAGGLCMRAGDLGSFAAIVARLLRDESLRRAVVLSQNEELKRHNPEKNMARILEALSSMQPETTR